MEQEDEDVPKDGDESLEEEGRGQRVFRFARRLMDRKELAEDTKDLLYTVVSTSDKAKTEAVRLFAREVRGYLGELKLKEDLLELATSHSLEISISLKPIADRLKEQDADSDDG